MIAIQGRRATAQAYTTAAIIVNRAKTLSVFYDGNVSRDTEVALSMGRWL